LPTDAEDNHVPDVLVAIKSPLRTAISILMYDLSLAASAFVMHDDIENCGALFAPTLFS